MHLPAPDPTTWFAASGPFVSCWLPALSASEDPARRLRLEWRHARSELVGAPEVALAAIDNLLGSERAHEDRASLLVFADATGTVAGLHLAAQPATSCAWVDALPRLGPVLLARQQVIPHIVVIADRAGADIEVVDHGEAVTEHVEGDTNYLHRSHPGGWSQRRYQQRAENTWERNAKGVAGEVDALVGEVGARLVVVAGDPRAVGFLTEHATDRLAAVLHHVEGAGRSDRDPFAEVAGEVHRLEEALVRRDLADVLEQFTAGTANGGITDGAERTLAMVDQGRVDRILVHDDVTDDRRAWFAPSARQAATDPDTLAALGLEPVEGRLVDVALWAAHTTGVPITMLPDPIPDGPSGGIGGLLRG